MDPADQPQPAGATSDSLEILGQLRAIRRGVDELLRLQAQSTASPAPRAASAQPVSEPPPTPSPGFGDEDDIAPPLPIRARRRRKTVLFVDDDEQTRRAALAALEGVQIPVRTVAEGNAALAAVAEEKPDVIVMELGISGPMAGKDVINMIKATMEWVDIPIVLYTRVPMEGQKEARTIHGGDEWVPKGPAGPEQLVQRVIQIFQKG